VPGGFHIAENIPAAWIDAEAETVALVIDENPAFPARRL